MALKDNPPDSSVVMERHFKVTEAERVVQISERTLWRMRCGIRSSRNGEMIYLRWTRRTGVGVVTSHEALDEFDYLMELPKELMQKRRQSQ